jgi:hydroxyacylglutathione hydrolase
MFFRQIYDPKLAQYSYLIGCQATREAIVVDPMRNVDAYLEIAAQEGLRVIAAAETHIHATSSGAMLAERAGVTVYVSAEGGAISSRSGSRKRLMRTDCCTTATTS